MPTFSNGGPSDRLTVGSLGTGTPLAFLTTPVGSRLMGAECDAAIHPESISSTHTRSSASGKYCRKARRNGTGDVAYETHDDKKLEREGMPEGAESTCTASFAVIVAPFLWCATTDGRRATISFSGIFNTASRLSDIDCWIMESGQDSAVG